MGGGLFEEITHGHDVLSITEIKSDNNKKKTKKNIKVVQ